MKQHRFFIYGGAVLALFTFLLNAGTRVYAGQAAVSGTTEESSSFVGDNFAPSGGEASVQVGSDGAVTISADGQISLSANVQANLDAVASAIASQLGVEDAIVAALLSNLDNTGATVSQIRVDIIALGVSPGAAENLVSALNGILGSEPTGIPVAQSTPGNDTTNNKDNNSESRVVASIDANKLNAAINAYNNMVRSSNPQVLNRLANDPKVKQIGRVLKQLRASLNKR